METGIKSSFIPQAPIVPASPGLRRSSFDFFMLLALVVFIASITLAAGVFLYAQFLSQSAASKRAQLERAKQAFEPALIQELTRLDDRMRAADTILENHVAPSALLHLLEQLTLQTISFSSFTFGTATDGLSVAMKGVARSVNSIALQADLMSKSGTISNPLFSNIARQADGVHFDFAAGVQPSSLRFKAVLVQPEAATQEAAPRAPASPFGTPDEQTTTP